MRSIKINKIAAIWLMMVLVVGFAQATKPRFSPLEVDVEQEFCIKGSYPKVGDIFKVVYRVRLKPGVQPRFGNKYWIRFTTGTYNPAEIIDKNEIFVPGLIPGEWKEFYGCFRIPEAYSWIIIGADITYAAGSQRSYCVGTRLELYLLDPLTGQYGTREEYERRLREDASWWYDAAGEFTSEPVSPDCAARNKEIIVQLKKLEPNLTDWEALYLHYDGIQALMGGMGDAKTSWEDRWKFLLEMGWLEKQRAGKEIKEKWLKEIMEKYKGKPLIKEQGLNPNFFRDSFDNRDNNSGSSDSTKQKRWSYFYFNGQFRYKKHQYNKDQGLLTQTVDMPLCSVLVRVRVYWSGQGTIWTIRTNTDANGYFHATLSWEVPQNIYIYAHPFVYIWGPTPQNRVIKVSDPTPPFSIYRDTLDTTIWFLPRVQGGCDTIWTGTDTYDFGTMYIDSFIPVTNPQPKSGAANIYETYLHARTFMSPPPTWPLRVMWEPGYIGVDTTSGYKVGRDTVLVCGYINTDEWDDDVLLHEFGHYLMDHYAQYPPNINPDHKWYLSDTTHCNTSYVEAWATFFSGRARVGYSTDSLFVNTTGGISSGNQSLWRNIENPWLGSGFDTLQFNGGPWCVGSLCGALWDIYDSYSEIPYHSYPCPGFPDTALADTLTMGFAPIWNVFDHYDPPGEPTNCWTIFHFRSGWNAFNYGHQFALNQILLHHRIRDSIPAKPTGLSAAQQGNAVRLYWRKNTESDLKGYRIYRRSKQEFTIPPQPWGSWGFLAEKSNPSDTTHLDQTVQNKYRYRYRVTAYDSLGNESEYSDSVEIFVQFGVNPDDIEMLSFYLPPLIAMKDDLKLCFSSVVNNQKVTLKLYDICGRMVQKQDVVLKKNTNNEFALSLENLSSGVYFVQIETEGYNKIQKVVIVR